MRLIVVEEERALNICLNLGKTLNDFQFIRVLQFSFDDFYFVVRVVQVSSLSKPRSLFQIIIKLFSFGNCWTFGSVCRNVLCTFLELEPNARLVIGVSFALHVWRIFYLTHDPSLFPDTASSLLRSAASHENLFMSVKLAFLSDIFTSIYVVEDVETLREFGIIQKKRNAGPPMTALYLMAFATVILC